MKEHSSVLSDYYGSGRKRDIQVKKDFDWALKIIIILRRLDGVLSHTIDSWKSFDSPDGDICFFRGVSVPAQRSLHAITASFRELQGDQKKLILLKSCYTDFSRAVSHISFQFLILGFHLKKDCTDNRGVVRTSLTPRSQGSNYPKRSNVRVYRRSMSLGYSLFVYV
jgi:hypothetical protein